MNSLKALSKLAKTYNVFIAISVLLSLLAFAFQTSRFNCKELDIISMARDGNLLVHALGGELKLDKTKGTFSVHCDARLSKNRDICGLTFRVTSDKALGVSLESFSELHTHVITKSTLPNYNQRTRVVIKSLIDPEIVKSIKSIQSDKHKYHAVRVQGNGDLIIPLSRFRVETWWEDENNVPFELSDVNVKSVVNIEFFVNEIPLKASGIYSIDVSQLMLFGKMVKEAEFYKTLSLFWLLIAGGMLFRFLYSQFLAYNKFKKQALNDPYCSLLNTFGFKIHYADLVGKNATVYRIRITNWHNLVQHFGLGIAHDLLQEVVKRSQLIFSSKFFLGSRLANDELVFIKKGERFSNDNEAAFLEVFLSPITVPELGDLCLDIKVGVSSEKKLPRNRKEVLERAALSIQAILHENMNLQIYSSEVGRIAENKVHIESRIKLALEKDAFNLLYMPIFDSSANKIVGVEALLRCTFPDLNALSPEVYISIAEETGLIRDIDLMVIEKALKDFSMAGFDEDFELSVNISSKELLDTSFVSHFERLVNNSGVSAERLCIEVTETFLLDIDPVSIKTIEKIRAIGCKVSLDDFGTGYTSFQQLVHFPVDEIKIDRSFVNEIGKAGYDAIINSLLSIASAYKYKVVAEGVENIEVYQSLLKKGCSLFQGYYISKPVPLAEIIPLGKRISEEGL
ncbi:EAL domain-containing protein [Marinomonas transparens]|uniref:EAL domain-containing protein n=1 Tax=Marinomonas transparens TaxID=2795388 RepID=A0A934JVK3_9GAMM|nr:EAL domain-containing protein [Marinomonas transparens]MBJ7539166.1 EAL domain-containing protein [Marinomonas transparens]